MREFNTFSSPGEIRAFVRFCSVGSAFVYPAWSLIYNATITGVDDPLWERAAVGLVCLAVYITTLFESLSAVMLTSVYSAAYLGTAHLFWVTVRNESHPAYQVGVMTLICAVSTNFFSRQSLIGYMVFVVTLCGGLAFYRFKPVDIIFYAAVITVLMMSLIGLYSRLRIVQKLEDKRRQLRAEHEKIKSVFDSAPHALFQIVMEPGKRQIVIHGERSPSCTEQIGALDEGTDFVTGVLRYFQLSDDHKAQLIAALELVMNDNILAFRLNEFHLPKEVNFLKDGVERIFQMEWTPVCLDQDAQLDRILVSMTDVTGHRADQLRASKAEIHNRKIIELAHAGQDRIRQSFAAIDTLLAKIAQNISHGMDHEFQPGHHAQIMIALHTIKGNVRSLGLSSFADTLHVLETQCTDPQQIQSAWLETCRGMFTRLQQAFQEYKDAAETLGWNQKPAVELAIAPLQLILEHNNWGYLQQLVARRHPDAEAFERFLSPRCVRLASLINYAFQASLPVLKRLHKPEATLQLDGADLWLESRSGHKIAWILPHLFANAFDHGIESPEERQEKGKAATGRIHVHMQRSESSYLLSYQDDGRGLCLAHIGAMAIKKGVISSEEWQRLSPQDQAMLIFKDGFSLKDEISEISGRGVGMSAVRDTLENLGGQVSLTLGRALGDDGYQTFSIDLHLPVRLVEAYDRETLLDLDSAS